MAHLACWTKGRISPPNSMSALAIWQQLRISSTRTGLRSSLLRTIKDIVLRIGNSLLDREGVVSEFLQAADMVLSAFDISVVLRDRRIFAVGHFR